MGKRLLRRPEVGHKTGLPSTTMYRMIDEGRFPRGIRLSERIRAWDEAEIDSWIEEQLKKAGRAQGAA